MHIPGEHTTLTNKWQRSIQNRLNIPTMAKNPNTSKEPLGNSPGATATLIASPIVAEVILITVVSGLCVSELFVPQLVV